MDAPKISVLMCAFNAESYATHSVSSILNQTFKDFELIIIENGSTDGTWSILLNLAAIDARIRLFRTNIKQLTFNLNYGINLSQGEYVVRMDADDVAESNRLEILYDAILKNPSLTVIGSAYTYIGAKSGKVLLPKDHEAIFRRLPFRGSICHPSVIIRKEALLAVGGYEGMRYVEDIDLWLKLRRKGYKFQNIEDSLMLYRVHRDQSRGRRESYYSLAGLLFREAFLSREIKFFMGALLTVFKGVILGR